MAGYDDCCAGLPLSLSIKLAEILWAGSEGSFHDTYHIMKQEDPVKPIFGKDIGGFRNCMLFLN